MLYCYSFINDIILYKNNLDKCGITSVIIIYITDICFVAGRKSSLVAIWYIECS